MVFIGTNIKVIDNSGARFVECIKVLGKSYKSLAFTGDLIIVSVKKALPNKKVTKGEIYKGLVVRLSRRTFRYGGYFLYFETSGIVLLNSRFGLIGTRVLSPVAGELRQKSFSKVLSLAPAVI